MRKSYLRKKKDSYLLPIKRCIYVVCKTLLRKDPTYSGMKVPVLLLVMLLMICAPVAFSAVKTYTGVGKFAMAELASPEQAKEYARERALQNAKDQAGVYVKSYSSTKNSRLTANEISAITNDIADIAGDVEYTTATGEVDGLPVVVYTAKVQVGIDDEGILKWLGQDKKEQAASVNHSTEGQKRINDSINQLEALDKQYSKTASSADKERIKKDFDLANQKLLAAQKADEAWKLGCYGKQKQKAISLYKEAIAIYQRVLELDPKDAESWADLGDIYGFLEKPDKAFECYDKALKIDPNNPWAWINCGGIYENAENYDEAVKCYRKAIELSREPQEAAEAWESLGFLYQYDMEDTIKAVKCYQEAIRLTPEDGSRYNDLGLAYEDLENYSEAMKCYQKALSLNPNDAAAWGNLGGIYKGAENYEEAIQCYRKAVSLNPKIKFYFEQLRELCQATGRMQEAQEAQRKAEALP